MKGIFFTFSSFIIDFISEGWECRSHHLDEIKGRSLTVVLSLELVEESFERASVTLKKSGMSTAH
jgi:hypothetical protein